MLHVPQFFILSFVFNDTATTEIYTLSLHVALPIWKPAIGDERVARGKLAIEHVMPRVWIVRSRSDRKSTRLNSSHRCISYAVFCLKKKKRPCQSSTCV